MPASNSPTIEVVPAVLPNQTEQAAFIQRRATVTAPALATSILQYWHLNSLDAPTVALVWALSFAWAAGTRLPQQAAMIITLGVWAVYVSDRLLDARAALISRNEDRLRERHYFHWRHKRVLAPLALVAGAAAAILVLAFIPAVARERDSVLAAASFAYFARVHHSQLSLRRPARPFFPPIVSKELLVGILFAVGCALPSMSAAWSSPNAVRWVLVGALAFFAALAWLNCHAIEQWESGAAHDRGLALLACALVLATIGFVAAALLCTVLPRAAILLAAAALSALSIAILDRIRTTLSPVTLRAAADLVLLVPALVIPFAGWSR